MQDTGILIWEIEFNSNAFWNQIIRLSRRKKTKPVCIYYKKYKPSGKCDKLHRITGLDVAGPSFEGMDSRLRLDPTDACYVDAIHTDDSVLGIRMSVGHDDFYPNGGDHQPGCESKNMKTLCQYL